MPGWAWFLVGLFVGANLGILALALCQAAAGRHRIGADEPAVVLVADVPLPDDDGAS